MQDILLTHGDNNLSFSFEGHKTRDVVVTILAKHARPEKVDSRYYLNIPVFYIEFSPQTFVEPTNQLWLNELLHALATDEMPTDEIVRRVNLVDGAAYLEVTNEIQSENYNLPWILTPEAKAFYLKPGSLTKKVSEAGERMDLSYFHPQYDSLRALHAVMMEA
jgi:hypothetical protein